MWFLLLSHRSLLHISLCLSVLPPFVPHGLQGDIFSTVILEADTSGQIGRRAQVRDHQIMACFGKILISDSGIDLRRPVATTAADTGQDPEGKTEGAGGEQENSRDCGGRRAEHSVAR